MKSIIRCDRYEVQLPLVLVSYKYRPDNYMFYTTRWPSEIKI